MPVRGDSLFRDGRERDREQPSAWGEQMPETLSLAVLRQRVVNDPVQSGAQKQRFTKSALQATLETTRNDRAGSSRRSRGGWKAATTPDLTMQLVSLCRPTRIMGG